MATRRKRVVHRKGAPRRQQQRRTKVKPEPEAPQLLTDSPPRPDDYVIAEDLAERHPGTYRGDPLARAMAEMEPCPLCGRISCDEHEQAPVVTTAPIVRRQERDPTPATNPAESMDRIVVAKQDHYEVRALPGTDRTTNVLMVTKGQQLRLSEAIAYRIEWAEQDGPAAFGLYFKDGVPHIEDPDGPHIRFEDGAIHQGVGYDKEVIDRDDMIGSYEAVQETNAAHT